MLQGTETVVQHHPVLLREKIYMLNQNTLQATAILIFQLLCHEYCTLYESTVQISTSSIKYFTRILTISQNQIKSHNPHPSGTSALCFLLDIVLILLYRVLYYSSSDFTSTCKVPESLKSLSFLLCQKLHLLSKTLRKY